MPRNNNVKDNLEQVFQEGLPAPPDDPYFKKIWDSIEFKAPIGEKYYLRTLFITVIFLGIFILLTLFYSDFLSSVLTLREIHMENARNFRVQLPDVPRGKEISKWDGIVVTTFIESKISLVKETDGSVVLDFFKGHILLDKTIETRTLEISMPGIKLFIGKGKNRLNLFCYDGMIRIIPIFDKINVEWKNGKEVILPGKTFFYSYSSNQDITDLVKRETVIIRDTRSKIGENSKKD